jgi:hypothetical protein
MINGSLILNLIGRNIKMKLRKFSEGDLHYRNIWIEPVDNINLFKHCSCGKEKVKEETFKIDVAPLLLIHGVEIVKFIK